MLRNNCRNFSFYFIESVVFALSICSQAIAQSDKPSIQIKMSPEHVILGKEENAEVKVTVSTSQGPIRCEQIRIHSNTGLLSTLKDVGEGRYSSTLTLPDDFFPRFALIAAVGTCGGIPVEGHTVIPLYGSGEVEVKAKAYSSVRLKIADETFGPKRTNEWGKARIPIIVPPGYSYGTVEDKKVDLNLPPVNRIVAIADRTEIMAGDEGRIIVWIFAIDPQGAPLQNGRISLWADKGETTTADAIAPGVYRAYYTGPKLIGDQSGNIDVSIKDDPASKDHVKFNFKPGKPSKIQIISNRPYFQAGETAPVLITAAIADQYGNPTGNPLSLTSDFGTLAPLKKTRNGAFETQLTLPSRFEDKVAVNFNAKGRINSKPVELNQSFALKAAAAKRIEIDVPEDAVQADGLTQQMIRVRVFDEFENPVIGEPLTLSASAGIITSKVISSAETSIPYIPPLGTKTGRSLIKVSLQNISESSILPLSSRTYMVAMTPRVGYILNMGNLSVFHSNLTIDQSLWFLFPGLHIAVEIGHLYSKATYKEEDIDSKFHILSIHGQLGYRYYFIPKLFASVNGGVGTNFAFHRTVYSKNVSISESASHFSFQFELELGYVLGPGSAVFQVGYGLSKTKKLESLSGNTNGLALMLGYRLRLF